MSVESRAAADHWTVGDDDVFEAIQGWSARGQRGVVVHVSTPTIPVAARPFLSSDEENRVLRRAWEVVVTHLSGTVVGKRQSWRDFVFLLEGTTDEAIGRARAIAAALEHDTALNKLVWRLVLSPVTTPWDLALRLAEPEEHAVTANAQRSIAVMAEGSLESPRVTVVAP